METLRFTLNTLKAQFKAAVVQRKQELIEAVRRKDEAAFRRICEQLTQEKVCKNSDVWGGGLIFDQYILNAVADSGFTQGIVLLTKEFGFSFSMAGIDKLEIARAAIDANRTETFKSIIEHPSFGFDFNNGQELSVYALGSESTDAALVVLNCMKQQGTQMSGVVATIFRECQGNLTPKSAEAIAKFHGDNSEFWLGPLEALGVSPVPIVTAIDAAPA